MVCIFQVIRAAIFMPVLFPFVTFVVVFSMYCVGTLRLRDELCHEAKQFGQASLALPFVGRSIHLLMCCEELF